MMSVIRIFILFSAGLLTVTAAGQTENESVLFQTHPAVETVALYTQSLQEAPAVVTVITRQQIRTFGYRTLGEVLSNVRGFHVTTDGAYHYLGIRGFGLPGDYNTRVLVMLNGHYLADNIYGAMSYFGQDFGLPMDLIQRIEIVRGPMSALYGSNGMFATINIFTRSPADSSRAYVSTETGSFRDNKAILSSSQYLGNGANLLVSASGYYNGGRSMSLAQLGGLRADRVGSEQGYHAFAQLNWKRWSFTANFQDRKALVPTGWFGTVFGDPGTSVLDRRNFFEAVYTRAINDRSELRWRASFDQYRYRGRYTYGSDEDESLTLHDDDSAKGEWVANSLSYRRKLGRMGNVTAGSSLMADLRNLQVTERISPNYLLQRHTSVPIYSWGIFSQYEKTLGHHWTIFAGVRLDNSRLDPAFVSPRIAAVWKRSEQTSWKFMYGRSFRNPSTYERFWEPNSLLNAEKMNTVEVAREQRFGNRFSLAASAYGYAIDGLIEGVKTEQTVLRYQNGSATRAAGIEIEANGRPATWLDTAASLSLYRTGFRGSERPLPNSPGKLVQFRASAPIGSKLLLGSAFRYIAERAASSGSRVGPVLLADITATTNRIHPAFDLQFGVRNLANYQYSDPQSGEHLLPTFPRAGRTAFLKLVWRHGE